MKNTVVEWRVPQAALDWDFETKGKDETKRAAFLLLRLFLPTFLLVAVTLYFVLPERLNAEFIGIALFGYFSIGAMITAIPLVTHWESRRFGIFLRLDEQGLERRRGGKRVRTTWRDLQHWEKRVTAHPGVHGLMAVELSIPFRGETIRRYWPFDPNETDAEQIAFLLRRGDDTA